MSSDKYKKIYTERPEPGALGVGPGVCLCKQSMTFIVGRSYRDGATVKSQASSSNHKHFSDLLIITGEKLS